MNDSIDLRVLGPLELVRAGASVALGGVKPRQLLATLALNHGRTVSTDQLIDALWPHDPPRSALANLHSYVSALRAVIGEERIRRQAPGYRLDLTAAELDLIRFEEWAECDTLVWLDRAVGLWRGEPVEDLPVPPLWSRELDRLRQLRRSARQTRARLRIESGRADTAVTELRELLADDALDEETWRLLITALNAAGRRADALAAYGDARRTLAAELGIEPGEPLRNLHRTLLTEPERLGQHRFDGHATVLLRGIARMAVASVPAWVGAALLDAANVTALLHGLVEARLLNEVGVDQSGQPRYAMPALIGLLAADLPDRAGRPDHRPCPPDAAATAADPLVRVLAGYLGLAEAASATLPPQVFGPQCVVAPRWLVHDASLITSDGLAWFATERDGMVAAVSLAAELGRTDLVWELAHALVAWCDMGGHVDVWNRTHQVALTACRSAADLLGEAVTLRGLGQLHLYQDRYDEAAGSFSRARLLFARLGNWCGVAGALSGLGTTHRIRAECTAALVCYRQALELYEQHGYRYGEAYAHGVIGKTYLVRGDLEEAARCLRTGLAVADEIGDSHRVALLAHQLAIVGLRAGATEQARAGILLALDRFTTLRDTRCQAYCLRDLAGLEPVDTAIDRLTGALDVFERIGDRRAQATTARRLGELHQRAGRDGLGEAYLAEAIRLHTAVDASG